MCIYQRRFGFAVCFYRDIPKIAVVRAVRIFRAVLFVVGVEVPAGGFEIRAFALAYRVDVDAVRAGREFD